MQRPSVSRSACALLLVALAACHDGGPDVALLPVDEAIFALRVTRGAGALHVLRWDMPPGVENPESFRILRMDDPYVGGPVDDFVVDEVEGAARGAPIELPADSGVHYLAVQPVRPGAPSPVISRILAVDTSDRIAFQTEGAGDSVWLAGAGPAEPARKVGEGRIVGWSPGSRQLALRSASGTNTVLSTGVPDRFAYATDPVTLPDDDVREMEIGSNGYVAFRAPRDDVIGLMVRLLEFDVPVHVRGRDVGGFLWSPSGDALVYLQKAQKIPGYELMLVDSLRLTRTLLHRQLLEDETVRHVRWSPTGQFLAFTISRIGTPDAGRLFVYQPARRTTFFVAPVNGDVIEWSPPVEAVPGQVVEILAFTSRVNGTKMSVNHFVGALAWPLDPTRTLVAQIAYPIEVQRRVDQLVWAASGTEILYIHTDGGVRQLSRFGLRGGPRRIDLGLAGVPRSLVASPDGRVACLVDRGASADVMVWQDGVIAPWFSSAAVHRVAWSTYGGRLAVLAGGTQRRLYRVDAAGATDLSAELGSFEQVVDFRWSDRATQARDRVVFEPGR